MRTLFCTLLLLPFLCVAQNTSEGLVFESVMLTPNPAKVAEFEAGMAAHNKKYHAEGTYGARVYWISSGANSGKYMWNMGPLPWSALDNRPSDGGHDEDWSTNVIPYVMPESNVSYMKFHPQLSNFSKDFTLKNLSVFMIDIKRFKNKDFMDKVISKVQKVYAEKMPDEIYGVYTNEMNNMEGRDFAWVGFFDSMAWMGKEDKFPQYFEEVHGEGSFKTFLDDVAATTNGDMAELWVHRKDLSGLSAEIVASSRQ